MAVRFIYIVSLLSLLVSSLYAMEKNTPAVRSTVYKAQNLNVIENFVDDPVLVQKMVDALVIKVSGAKNVPEAWRTLIQPNDVVGIKISAVGGPWFSSHKSVVNAIVSGLIKAGHSPNKIIVWDRADMRSAGFRTTKKYAVQSVEPFIGYDAKTAFSSAVLGKMIWGDLLFREKEDKVTRKIEQEEDLLSSKSHWSNIVSRKVTKIINVPVMTNSVYCGVAGAVYNVTIPNVDNWRRFLQPPGYGDPFLCELYADPVLSSKIVLHIMDGLIAQYAGGPEFEPNYAFHHGAIYASKDPIALDATAVRVFDQWRAPAKLPSAEKQASFLKTAEQMKLGIFSEDRIDVVEVSLY